MDMPVSEVNEPPWTQEQFEEGFRKIMLEKREREKVIPKEEDHEKIMWLTGDGFRLPVKPAVVLQEDRPRCDKPWEGKLMTLNDYQEAAKKTANFHGCMMGTAEHPVSSQKEALLYCSLGLAGESGEVIENTKKYLRDDASELTESRRDRFLGELGDVLWYLANLSDALGFTLEDVASYNITKLNKRYSQS